MLIVPNSVAHGPQRCLQVPNFPAGKFEAGSCPLVADPPSEESPTYTSAVFTDYITTLLSTSYVSGPTGSVTSSVSTETATTTSATTPSFTLTISHSASPTQSSTLTTGASRPTAVPSCHTAPASVSAPVHENNVTEFAARYCRIHFNGSAVFHHDSKPIGGVGGPIDGVSYNYSLAWTTDECPSGVTAQQLPSEGDCGTIYHNDWKSCKSPSFLRHGTCTPLGDIPMCNENRNKTLTLAHRQQQRLGWRDSNWMSLVRFSSLSERLYHFCDSVPNLIVATAAADTRAFPDGRAELSPQALEDQPERASVVRCGDQNCGIVVQLELCCWVCIYSGLT